MTIYATRPSGKWSLWIPPRVLDTLRENGELHLAVLLARMIDALRFGLASAYLCRNESCALGDQQRHTLVMYLAATVNELEDWRKGHAEVISRYEPLAAAFIQMDAVEVAPAYRAAMGRLRNKVVSHFDEEPFEPVVKNLLREHLEFATGSGDGLLTESNDLANAVVGFFALDVGTDHQGWRAKHLALLNAAVARANAFAVAGREALHSHLRSRGAVYSTPEIPSYGV